LWSFSSSISCPSLDDCPKELIITLPGHCCPFCHKTPCAN
jgi:hypothetical protein